MLLGSGIVVRYGGRDDVRRWEVGDWVEYGVLVYEWAWGTFLVLRSLMFGVWMVCL